MRFQSNCLGASRIMNSLLVVALLSCFPFGNAFPQSYPAKPIRFVVTMPPGGSTDVLARLVGQKLSEKWGQQVLVDNRAGASGIIGMEFGAKAAPDGYTVVVAASNAYAINPSLFRKLPYDVLKDFTPVAALAQNPFVLMANPSLPVKSLKEMIVHAKANPGRVNYASVGTGSAFHVAMEMLKSMAGIDIVHVPYKGAAASLNALLSGEVQLSFDALLTTIPLIKSGRVRALAVTGATRSSELPDLPTVAEAGVPGFEVAGGFGVLVPSGTPNEIVNKLNAEIATILRMPDVRLRFVGLGAEPVGNTPEEFAANIRFDIEKWAKVIKEANIPLE